jgi:hypothetical protein
MREAKLGNQNAAKNKPPTDSGNVVAGQCAARLASSGMAANKHVSVKDAVVANHLVSHCREIVLFRQARNPGKLQNTVHCNHRTVPAGGSAAQVARRQNPKRGLRRSCPDWDEQ